MQKALDESKVGRLPDIVYQQQHTLPQKLLAEAGRHVPRQKPC